MGECVFPNIWKNETNQKCTSKCPEGTCPRYDVYGNFKCARDCSLTKARNLATGLLNIGANLAIGSKISDSGTPFDATRNRRPGIYYGPLKSNVPEGIGLMTFDNGDVYYGDWKYGKMDGNGIILDSNGYPVYEGEFTNDMMDGRGTQVYSNKDYYQGQYSNSKKQGWGKWHGANGTYEGEWDDDQINGRGKFVSADGSVYDGNWLRGMKSGKGKFTNYNGSIFEGTFLNSAPQNLLPSEFCQGQLATSAPYAYEEYGSSIKATAPPIYEDEY